MTSPDDVIFLKFSEIHGQYFPLSNFKKLKKDTLVFSSLSSIRLGLSPKGLVKRKRPTHIGSIEDAARDGPCAHGNSSPLVYISDIQEIDIYNHFTVYLLMPVVTLQSLEIIGRLEVSNLGRGPQILLVLNVFMRQMGPLAQILGGKFYFRFLMFQNGSKNQYLSFQNMLVFT